MTKYLRMFSLLALVACENNLEVEKAASLSVSASDICAGKVIAGISGTANCSATSSSIVAGEFYIFASRNDLTSIDMTDPGVLADIVSGTIDRSNGVATFKATNSSDDFLNFFKSRYQVISNPVSDSDGAFGDNPEGVAKKHYLETIVGRPDQECGTSGTLTQRIDDCSDKNAAKAFYNGVQYGQMGEGNWKLVSRLLSGQEVWRDERTKLLWSDSSSVTYSWFHATGYAKDSATSLNETFYISEPGLDTNCFGSPCQPAAPISVCAEINASGEVIGGGADPLYDGTYAANPETSFKGNLNISHNVLWKLPSIDDFKLADVNGIRKVLPNMAGGFWASTYYSFNRSNGWLFWADGGYYTIDSRHKFFNVRCVGLSNE